MIDTLAICGQCNQHSIVMVDILPDGSFIGACLYCDLPQEEDGFAIYENHCWNCGYGIDSRFSRRSVIPGMGYYCSSCGKDLVEWKLMKGLVSITQIIELIGGQNHVTVVL